jgi:hypothetical protein
MPWVGVEPAIPAFEWAKKAHVLDRAATVIGGVPSDFNKIMVISWLAEQISSLEGLSSVVLVD